MAQPYIRQPVASLSRPLRELRGFAKAMLKVGETRTARFKLDASKPGAHDERGRYVLDPGEVEIDLGGPSRADAKTWIMLTKS